MENSFLWLWQRRWALLTAAAACAILAIVALLEPHFTYNRWDNY